MIPSRVDVAKKLRSAAGTSWTSGYAMTFLWASMRLSYQPTVVASKLTRLLAVDTAIPYSSAERGNDKASAQRREQTWISRQTQQSAALKLRTLEFESRIAPTPHFPVRTNPDRSDTTATPCGLNSYAVSCHVIRLRLERFPGTSRCRCTSLAAHN